MCAHAFDYAVSDKMMGFIDSNLARTFLLPKMPKYYIKISVAHSFCKANARTLRRSSAVFHFYTDQSHVWSYSILDVW